MKSTFPIDGIWRVIESAFEDISKDVQGWNDAVTVSTGHFSTDYFPLRCYAQFGFAGEAVVVSFDVHRGEGGMSVSSDVSTEQGLIHSDVLEQRLVTDSNGVLDLAREFAIRSRETAAAARALMTDLTGKT